jgi:RNA polymerase sigma-70 factor, ECF subfamily
VGRGLGHATYILAPDSGPLSISARMEPKFMAVLNDGSTDPVQAYARAMMGASPGCSVEREEILLKLRERIVAFAACHSTGDAAEDVAQEVLILLHEKYSHVDRLEELVPLSLQIARFKIMSLRRKSQRRGEYTQVSVTDIQLPDLEADPAVLLERKQMLERLEIQERMAAQSIKTVYTWDHRCRNHLLELMGGDWEPEKK